MAEQGKTRKQFEADIVARAWKNEAFKKELIANPKAVLQKEMDKLGAGKKLPDNLTVTVLQEDAKHVHMVIPRKPSELSGQEISDEQLEAVAGGTAAVIVVGVAAVVVVFP